MNFRDNGAVAAFRRGDLDQARTLTQAQLAAEPQAPALQHLMGLIQCRMGELDSGVEWLKRASEAEPDNVAYRVMLARALVDSGRAAEALQVASPPSGTSAAELALWHARAEAADAIEDWHSSAEAWSKLYAAGVADWRVAGNYANALAALGRWNEAVRAFNRALELNPEEIPLRRSLATALMRTGRYDESADELKRWVDASPENPANRIAFARLLADLGRNEEATSQLDEAARLTTGESASTESGASLFRLASGSRGGGVDLPTLKELASLLERTNRMDALRELLDEAEAVGIRREQIAYPSASSALRQG